MTISNLMQVAESFPIRVEYIVGKEEIAHYEQFSPFDHSVFKRLYCRHVKARVCLRKG